MTTWTVLANGPSLAKINSWDLGGGGPIVAVNTAVLAANRLPIDFWSVGDPPIKMGQVWEPLSVKQRAQLPVVWCREHLAFNWNKLGVRAWHHPNLEDDFRTWAFDSEHTRTTSLMNLTVTTTVSRCIAHGATKVILFGVDMEGVRYSVGSDPNNRSEKAWRHRWGLEKRTFELATQEWDAAGVEVVRRRAL